MGQKTKPFYDDFLQDLFFICLWFFPLILHSIKKVFEFEIVAYSTQIARDVSKLTHAHKYGYLGGILQAVAVHEVLQTENIQPKDFIKNLQDIMKNLESNGTKCFENANYSQICEKDEQAKSQIEL